MASSEVGSPRMDIILRALSDDRRRRILRRLREKGARENGGLSVPKECHIEGEDPDDLLIALYHNHLPRLEDSELIRWDKEAAMVSMGPRFYEVEPLLEYVS